ncbi:MAG: hypothetical protein ACLFR8_12915 [Alkalispirochaeta sp.]
MDKKKLKEILSKIFGEEVAEELVDTATDEVFSEIEALVRTKDTLRDEVKELRKKTKRYEEIDLDEIEAMRTELEELRDGATESDDDPDDGKPQKGKNRQEIQALIDRETRKLKDEIEKRDKRINTLVSTRDSALIDREINGAVEQLEDGLTKDGKKLTAAGRRYLNEVLRYRAQVVEEDEDATVVFPSSDGINLPPGEYLQDWSRSDAAKDFIAAPQNAGGGSGGSDGTPGGKKPEEYTEQERIQLYRRDPAMFNKLFGGN